MWYDDAGDEKGKSGRKVSLTFHHKFSDATSMVIPKRRFAEKAMELIGICVNEYPLAFSNNHDSGDIYSGAGGLAYAFLHLTSCPELADEQEQLRCWALSLVEASVQYSHRSEATDFSFFYGKAGIYALSAVVFKRNGKEMKANDYLERYVHGQWHCKDKTFSASGSDDLANGRAGYIAGLIWLSRYFSPNEVRLYALNELLQVMIDSGMKAFEQSADPFEKRRLDPVLAECTSPLIYKNMDSYYLGMLMGLGGILRVLLLCPYFLDERKQVDQDVKAGVDFLLGLINEDGSFPDKLESANEKRPTFEDYAQWKTGGVGIAPLMAAAYLRWKEGKYLLACSLCSEFAWKKGLSKTTFGIANGAVGSCYLFLLMYRITCQEKYLVRALKFTEFLLSEKYLGPFTKDNKRFHNFSLMEGVAGIVVLLVDIINPNEADFPFLPLVSPIGGAP